MMNKRKNNLDEMQEQKLLKIEHNGMWFAFWGLLAIMLIQVVIGRDNFIRNIAGEWFLLMCLSVYSGVACIKNGIWDRKLKPNLKTNILLSFVSAAILGLVIFLASYFRFHNLFGAGVSGWIVFGLTFFLEIITLTITTLIYKKKSQTLEEENNA